MKIKIGNKVFDVEVAESALSESICRLIPLSLTLTRSGEHEYYGALPEKAETSGVQTTSHVVAGGIYYFEAWNAFSLNFKDMYISPYKVHVVGKAEEALAEELLSGGSTLEISVLE